MKPQTAAVLKHLQQHGSITNVEANAVHKIRSVSSRITELAKLGYVISKTRKVDATDQPYVRYTLATLEERPIQVGDRVRVIHVDKRDATFYSSGAEGIVDEVDDEFYVHFLTGKFLRKYDNRWFIPKSYVVRV